MRRSCAVPVAALLVAAVAACGPADLPDPESSRYGEAAAAFWRGLTAAEVGETSLATASFERVAELAPGEPAAWANLAVVQLQRRELEAASVTLASALALAPDDSRIHLLAAVVAQERGSLDSATAELRRATELDPANLRAAYLLAQRLEAGDPTAGAVEAAGLLDRILAAEPGNLVALLERARLAARQEDPEGLRQALDRIAARADSIAAPITADLQRVRAQADGGAFEQAAIQLAFVESALQPLPAYQDAEAAVRPSPTRLDLLVGRFLRLPMPTVRVAAPDSGLTFASERLDLGRAPVTWVRTVWLSETVPGALIAAGRDSLWISPAPGVADAVRLPGVGAALAPLDYDYDFRVDLALAGSGGLRLMRQDDDGSFTDVTAQAVPGAAARGRYTGVWAADLDLEGDLDLVLAAADGPATALRNRGDGTFDAYPDFPAVRGLTAFAWADLDADGDPDAAALDADGHLSVFANRRSQAPQFVPLPEPAAGSTIRAVTAADMNQDATIDLIVLDEAGTVRRLSLGDGTWTAEELARWPDAASANRDAAGLFVADLDNNGASDLVVALPAAARVWLAGPEGLRVLTDLRGHIGTVGDVSGDGRLDLAGTTSGGEPQIFVANGTTGYYSATILTHAAEATGDRRINSFGIGGEIEVRAGRLYQKRVIDQPAMHFGLGDQPQVDVARLIWPNGSVQAEFNLPATNETILTRQRLKGSCPWVFTDDGTRMQFVTDFLWRTALGLRINAQGAAAVIHSEDWIRIRGDQLAARDGFYDVRITGDLWESHFFDYVGLMVVDHPESTMAFVDERFTLPAPTPAVISTAPPRNVAWARDQDGRDVTALVGTADEQYLDTFARGPYQGIAADHFVEVALGDEAPTSGPLWLVAYGWVYPTDASINVAVSQGTHPAPQALRLDVPDGAGGWVTVRPNLGFPAGKTKTVLIDLQNVFRPGTERRLRLATNMEIYWDQIRWAVGRPEAPVDTQRLQLGVADLRYRGFSRVSQAGRAAPELPDYAEIASAAPQWRDLVGFHTRFGDVRPLVAAVDDRYVIMNAGDELVFRFPAPPAPAAGWTRDFVLIGDGWVKDGDLNTGYSTTVAPLPYHGLTDYARPPGRLTDDPGYRRHPEDWRDFHTRYVTPRVFHHALVPDRER
ncbi:MAG: FG-GAP-like repeat-containing protein [Gemmatimonadota bacterium]|nr:FG-GAP-like repeat-containing protein [Gemmatimonadota bacterium]